MQQRYQRVEGLLLAEVDEDVLLFDATRGTYFATSGVGSLLWGVLAEPRTLEELCQEVLAHYEVEPEVCAADVTTFVAHLEAARLVSTAP
jgi:hypothetical protein